VWWKALRAPAALVDWKATTGPGPGCTAAIRTRATAPDRAWPTLAPGGTTRRAWGRSRRACSVNAARLRCPLIPRRDWQHVSFKNRRTLARVADGGRRGQGRHRAQRSDGDDPVPRLTSATTSSTGSTSVKTPTSPRAEGFLRNLFRPRRTTPSCGPAFGENSRVLNWGDRAERSQARRKTHPSASFPTAADMDLDGLDVDAADSTRPGLRPMSGREEVPLIAEWFEVPGEKLPTESRSEVARLKATAWPEAD